MKKLFVGIQLYGLRDLLENMPDHFEEVMRQVKQLGYDGVELAGLYGLKPEFVKEVLDRVGLVPICAHVPLPAMLADAEKVARDYEAIGCKYIGVPYLPEEYRPLADGFETILSEIERIGRVMQAHGMTLLYHNHDFEFVKLEDGTYGLDEIYRRLPKDLLQAEPDTCWIEVAGERPAEFVRRYTGRCPLVHLKDYIKTGKPANLYKLIGIDTEEKQADEGYFGFRAVGFGQQIWEPILQAASDANAEWVIVEQDEHYELHPMECARRSREYLRILGC
ncbi:MAG TPA: sugar phosphate isomerase/epimerase [Clostridiales bacterium]|nr:sugar phosphate isomerase/epimerase [Clostridiales bacterium]